MAIFRFGFLFSELTLTVTARFLIIPYDKAIKRKRSCYGYANTS
ncbi:hypothetical protein KE3_0995 [Streptococcus lutetiensis 033]|uniref:Uncharacterized protein n=2 Tax=Streptococcus TaxID=1301 RepID=A0A139R6A3_9STRE|nr:hypothetical protein KE3_0995 [Streptococcus lutetiensis 033]KXU10281.1 hypothetical protein SGADD03_00240 [Streptococcus gallolyticus]BAK29028.1 putative extracellular protein [Streptococcus gallolyticus subsp. gallolyticus ATCC 43143]